MCSIAAQQPVICTFQRSTLYDRLEHDTAYTMWSIAAHRPYVICTFRRGLGGCHRLRHRSILVSSIIHPRWAIHLARGIYLDRILFNVCIRGDACGKLMCMYLPYQAIKCHYANYMRCTCLIISSVPNRANPLLDTMCYLALVQRTQTSGEAQQ